MKPEAKPAAALPELRTETREFLAKLEPSDLAALESGVRLVRRVEATGTVMKWLAITAVSIIVGLVAIGEGVQKIGSWFKTP